MHIVGGHVAEQLARKRHVGERVANIAFAKRAEGRGCRAQSGGDVDISNDIGEPVFDAVKQRRQRRTIAASDVEDTTGSSRVGDTGPAVVGLTGTYHNLLRMLACTAFAT